MKYNNKTGHDRKYNHGEKLQMVMDIEIMTQKAVAVKHKCHRDTVLRVCNAYAEFGEDGLFNKDPTPKTPHPNAQTQEEIAVIKMLVDKYPEFMRLEIWNIAKREYGYKRHPMTCSKTQRKLGKPKPKPKPTTKHYNKSKAVGEKVQLDVKEVPAECYTGRNKYRWVGSGKKRKKKLLKFYQYTMIDEANSKRFVAGYNRHTAGSTKEFIWRAIKYLGYIPKTIQTDNGREFTNRFSNTTKINLADKVMDIYGIDHKLIKPASPTQNCLVERSHRTDQEHFYNHLQFKSLREFNNKLTVWLNRYNNCPSSAIRDRFGKQRFQSPNEKEQELLDLLQEQSESPTNSVTIAHCIIINSKKAWITEQVTLPIPRFIDSKTFKRPNLKAV